MAATEVHPDDAAVAERAARAARLRREVRQHLAVLGLSLGPTENRPGSEALSKDRVRQLHSVQRASVLDEEYRSLARKASALIDRFATGHEIDPESISPRLVEVHADTPESDLFRLATTLWSVPVSRGYGRRIRYLVTDDQNGKLIGLFALGDPVFNLRVRDEWIGWTTDQRRRRLVSVMDAFVAGSVPPYNQLLGGKLVVSLMGSREIVRSFTRKYGRSVGGISGESKSARLALITVTSALGRSSLYNRVRLPNMLTLYRIGETNGWGHFHIPENLFSQMRELLALDGHRYANGHQYGDGPNWRIRVIREALDQVGLKGDLLRHGVCREVYALPMASNWREYLRGDATRLNGMPPKAADIADAALRRWVLPRAERMPGYRSWQSGDTRALFRTLLAD